MKYKKWVCIIQVFLFVLGITSCGKSTNSDITASQRANITSENVSTSEKIQEYMKDDTLYLFLKDYTPPFDTAIEIPIFQSFDLSEYYYDTSLLVEDVLYKIVPFEDGSTAYGLIHKFDMLDSGEKIASTGSDEQAVFLQNPDGTWDIYVQDWYCLCSGGMTQAPCDLFLQDIDSDNNNELIVRNTYAGSMEQVVCTLDIYKKGTDEPITLDSEVIDNLITENVEIKADSATGMFEIRVNDVGLTYQADLNNISSKAFDVQSFMPSSYSTFYTIDNGLIKAYMCISGGGMPSGIFYLCAELCFSNGVFSFQNPTVENYDPALIPKQYIAMNT